ncbi:MAG: hypothetical protein Q4P30_05075 [Eubacteriales bacterium]|nr:hypothetical protein [Eubacteriales bacterium]
MKDIKTMNLQFFAHKDGDVDNPEDVAKKTEPKQGQQSSKPEDGLNDKGDDKPEQKYSDEDVNRIIDGWRDDKDRSNGLSGFHFDSNRRAVFDDDVHPMPGDHCGRLVYWHRKSILCTFGRTWHRRRM